MKNKPRFLQEQTHFHFLTETKSTTFQSLFNLTVLYPLITSLHKLCSHYLSVSAPLRYHRSFFQVDIPPRGFMTERTRPCREKAP